VAKLESNRYKLIYLQGILQGMKASAGNPCGFDESRSTGLGIQAILGIPLQNSMEIAGRGLSRPWCCSP